MQGSRSAVFSEELKEVAAGLARWRRGRRGGEPIPEPLWTSAVELASRFGISPVAIGLGLNHTALKERVLRSRPDGAEPLQGPVRFVELPGARPLAGQESAERCESPSTPGNPTLEPGPPRTELRLQIQAADGSTLRVELSAHHSPDLARVIAACWEGACSR